MTSDWLRTLRHILPRAASIVRSLRPTFRLGDVRGVDRDFLERHDVRGVVWDVDGTLTAYLRAEIAAPFRDHLHALFRDARTRHAIASNCSERRFLELGRLLPEAAIVRVYATAAGTVYRQLLGGVDTHRPEEVEAILRAGGRAVRKPSPDLVTAAARHALGDPPMAAVLVVGDQYLTDVAAGNLAGARSVKVDTYARETFPPAIRAAQRAEAILHRALYGRPC